MWDLDYNTVDHGVIDMIAPSLKPMSIFFFLHVFFWLWVFLVSECQNKSSFAGVLGDIFFGCKNSPDQRCRPKEWADRREQVSFTRRFWSFFLQMLRQLAPDAEESGINEFWTICEHLVAIFVWRLMETWLVSSSNLISVQSCIVKDHKDTVFFAKHHFPFRCVSGV